MFENNTNGAISFGEVVEEMLERFDHIGGIDVDHPSSAEAEGTMIMTVHTLEGSWGEFIEDSLPSSDVVVELENGERVRKPIWIQIDPSGPAVMENERVTKIFRPDNSHGESSLALEDGIERLRKKLNGVCPTCNGPTESIAEHYRESIECSENLALSTNL